MNLAPIFEHAKPGDIILTGSGSFLGKLIRAGQSVQTRDGRPSRWSHVLLYISSNPEEQDGTIAESTMDYKPYGPTGKRLDNGAQFNQLSNLREAEYGELLCMPLTNAQRQEVIDTAAALIHSGRYRYPVAGLFGSLLSFWVLDHIGLGRYNPLQSRRALYCSAFVQLCYREIGIDFDPRHSERNTSPELISQCGIPGVVRYGLEAANG